MIIEFPPLINQKDNLRRDIINFKYLPANLITWRTRLRWKILGLAVEAGTLAKILTGLHPISSPEKSQLIQTSNSFRPILR